VNTLSYRTISANKATVKREWLIVDAENEVLGRLTSKIASILRGKNRPYFTPHANCGDKVIVINAEKIRVTGNKTEDKEYTWHSGYPGGQKVTTFKKLIVKKPIAPIEKAVKGMLPKNKLGSAIFKNLYVYAGTEHPHEAQQPRKINLNEIK